MNISFEIIDGDPSREWIQVKYSNDSGRDYYTNLSPSSFVDSDIQALVEGYAPVAVAYFERTVGRSDELSGVTLTGSFTAEAEQLEINVYPTQYPDSTPAFDPWTQYLDVGPHNPGDQYYTWVVVDMDSAEETAYYNDAVASLKAERNARLFDTLWIFAEDDSATNESDWLTYRQELKDVTDQAGWPKTFTWPTPPTRPDY